MRDRLGRLGDVLTKAFSLRGFFGVDFIEKDGVPWPVEINPRYTAGVEVLERATGSCLFSCHREVFSGVRDQYSVLSTRYSTGLCGKAILFAKEPLDFPSAGPWQESLHHSWLQPEGPEYADIPHPGCPIKRGQPVLTLFAHAAEEADCLEILRAKALALDRQLFG
jgi:predicted ATP-grasp superfamily ATP-dependent carboligase